MEKCRRSVLLTGGGTGGHLAIVRSVKEELLKMGVEPYYIGSTSGQDRVWFEDEEGFAKKLFLSSRGVVDKRGFSKAASLFRAVRSSLEAARFMKKERVEAVLSVGGFSAAPASFASVIRGIPLYIHEQNAVSGRLNKLLKPFAERFFSSYEEEYVDYPVRECFFESARTRTEVKRVIFLGGSQGSSAINDFALSVATGLGEHGIKIVHQCGGKEYGRVKMAYDKLGVEADLFAFDKRLHEKIASADLAISRAGASTLWELAANRIPTLFVPYPYAAGDHQYKNAMFLAQKGGAWVQRESSLRPKTLWDIVNSDIEKVSLNLEGAVKPGGAKRVAEALLSS